MINYDILNESLSFYKKFRFERIELPWTVTKEISDITKPSGCDDFTIIEKNKVLVASGEQSFLYLYCKGFLPKGRFMGITPCFRNDSFDALHTKYFMKNELIVTDVVTSDELQKVIDLSMAFFSVYVDVRLIKTETSDIESFDIVSNKSDVELGSYGIRKCDFLHYIYGTGVAEPRLSSTVYKEQTH